MAYHTGRDLSALSIGRVLLQMKYFNEAHKDWVKFQAAIAGAKLK